MEIQVQGYDYQYCVTWQIFWIREMHLLQPCWQSSSTHSPSPQVASSQGNSSSILDSHQNILYSRWVCSVGSGLCLRKAFEIIFLLNDLHSSKSYLYEQVKSYFNKTQTKTRTTSTNFSPKMQNNFQLMFRSFPKLNLKFLLFQRRWRAKPIHYLKGCNRF